MAKPVAKAEIGSPADWKAPCAARAKQALAQAEGADIRQRVRIVADVMMREFKQQPTPDLVREILGRGSLSTIVSELRSLWSDMSQRAMLCVQLQDIPSQVAEGHQQMLGTLWSSALDSAKAQIGQQLQDVIAERDALAQKVQQLQQELASSQAQLLALRSEAAPQQALTLAGDAPQPSAAGDQG